MITAIPERGHFPFEPRYRAGLFLAPRFELAKFIHRRSLALNDRRPPLDGIPSGFRDVLPSRRRGPPDVTARKLRGVPPRVLLHPVVVAAGRVPVAQTGPTARLVRDVVFEITSLGGTAAAGPGAGGVPDLGQVPEHDPGIVALGLPPVIAVPGRQRPDLDHEVLLPGGEPPAAVAARRAGLTGGSEGKRWSGRRGSPAGFSRVC